MSGTDGKAYTITHLETKKSLTRKAIDQLGFVKDTNSLVVLSRASFVIFSFILFDSPQRVTGYVVRSSRANQADATSESQVCLFFCGAHITATLVS
jgi:hypothetical protein